MDEMEKMERDGRVVVGEIAGELVKLGTAWLRYGLSVGESSLEASARTLQGTARVLGRIAARIRND